MSGLSGIWGHPVAVVTDTIISMVIVAPLVVGYWRGTWFLLDTFLYPHDEAASCWISLAIGFGILLLATWFQRPLQTIVTRQNRCVFFLASRLYTFILCLGCVNHWRGVWSTLDHYTGTQWTTATMSLLVGITGLVWLRAFRNIMAPPLVIITDGPEEYFTFPTMFRTAENKECHLIVMDGLFSVVIVGSLVVLVWRGSFHYLDLIMFPDNIVWSAFGSTILGYATSLLSFALQAPLGAFCHRVRSGFWRVAVMDLFTAVSYVGSVNVWRGLWNIYDLYLFPDHKVLSCVTTHVAGLIILSLCYCAHSILVRGVYLDAEEPGATAAILPYFYTRYFIQKWRTERMKNAPANEEEDDDDDDDDDDDERLERQQQYRKYQARRSSRENGWLSDEIVTMIDDCPSSMADDSARWRRGSCVNDQKESTI